MQPVIRATQRRKGTRIGAIQALPVVLHELGVEPRSVFAEAGIAPRVFSNADNRIANADMCRLLHLCVHRTGCDHFGLLVGSKASLASLGFVGLLARNAPDVGTALRAINRYLGVNNHASITALSEHGAVALWSYAIYEPGLVGTDQVSQAASAVACNILRELCGREFVPEEVMIPFSRPQDPQPFRGVYGAHVRFDADHMNIVFARSWLLRPVHGANPSLYGKLMQQAAKLEAKRAAALPDVVRRVLRRLMMAGRGSIEDVAAIFSVHRRTLDRRLDAHGATFRQIAEEVRFDVARQLLRDTAMSISEIAAALHYASPSAFATAFRRWSGTTASRWRRSAEPKSDAERKRAS